MDNVFDELLPNIDDESQLTTPLCDKEEKDFNNKYVYNYIIQSVIHILLLEK